jgi:hypothetical protein
MTRLERRCRLLLLAYPAAYRRERGEEIIGTLLEAMPAGRSWPLARDIRALVMGGLRARAAVNRRLTTAANLRIAVIVGTTAYVAFSALAYLRVALLVLTAPTGRAYPAGWLLLAVAALVASTVAVVWVSIRRAALLAVTIAAAAGVSLAGAWRPAAFGWPVTELACLATLAVLAGRGERPGRRWLWLVLLVGAMPVVAGLMPAAGTYVFGTLLVALGIVSVLWVVIDARPAIATAAFLLAFWLPSGIDNLSMGNGIAAGVPLLAIITVVTAIAVWLLRRQSARITAGHEH